MILSKIHQWCHIHYTGVIPFLHKFAKKEKIFLQIA